MIFDKLYKANNLSNKIEDLLMPCPFCGREAKLRTFVTSTVPQYSSAFVECKECNGRTKTFVDFNQNGEFLFEAIEAWNGRAKDGN